MKDMRMKALAMAAVAVMLAVSAVPIMSGGDADASSDYWTYAVTLNDDGTVTVTGSGSAKASPTAAGAVGTEGAYTSSTGLNVGDWGFDSTGHGPFGSFYAAFDASNGNKMICILNPNNLNESIDGNITLSTDYASSIVNIMWVLPTVYWSVDSSGNLVLSNDPSKGTAYAHTIDGDIHEYLGIGVYEASTTTVNEKTVLTSTSGTKPFYLQTRETFRTYANNNTVATEDGTTVTGHAMLWNLYMWQLYRFAVITTGGGMNSQAIFGNGDVYGDHTGSNVNATGDLDTSGPYAGYVKNPNFSGSSGTHDQSVKAFIEDAWGSLSEFVDGVVIYGANVYATQSSKPMDNGSYYPSTPIGTLPSSSGYGSTTTTSSTNAGFWGLPTGTSGSASSGLYDYIYSVSDGKYWFPYGLFVGGSSVDNRGVAPMYGLSFMGASNDVYDSNESIGGRLAFVYDADSASSETHTITFMKDSTTTYKTDSVSDGGTISAPDAPTMTNKVFGGWYTDVGCTQQYNFSSTVDKDLILYAKWYSVLVFSSKPTADGIFAYTNG